MGKAKQKITKRREVRVSSNAYQNIYEITHYIAIEKQQPLNAVKVSNAIYATMEHLGENPFAFKEYEELPTKTKIYRKAICLSWLIIYKITVTEIIILGVIHQAKNPSKIEALRKVK